MRPVGMPSNPKPVVPRPGQMYGWLLDTDWILEVVVEERRHSMALGRYVVLKRSDAFFLVVGPDPGPCENRWVNAVSRAHYMVMLGGKLVWMDSTMFDPMCSRLVSDG